MKDLDFSSLNNAILASAAYMIIATDTEGRVLVFNREAERALGYAAEDIVGSRTVFVWHDPEEVVRRAVELTQELGRAIEPGFTVFTIKPNIFEFEEREWTFIRKDGTRFPVSLSVTSLRDTQGAVTGYLGIAKDITERRNVERMKNEFISVVSHELRTPLTSIRGALGLIAGGTVGALPDKAMNLVTIAHKNSERLVHIINDILDIEKVESGGMQLNLRRIKAAPFLRQALEANQAYGDKYQVHFVLEEAPEDADILADPDRLMQVMANLLSNAAKFSPSGKEVTVRASRGNGNVLFEVKDRGPGIPEEFRQHMFEKFAQADTSTTRRYDGTGLGLSITKRLVEAMGGSIGFDTHAGKGTVFFFYLPEADAPQNAAELPPPVLSEEACYRVLICEDDEAMALFMQAALEEEGFMTDVARDIGEARRKLNSGHYAAMTLDLVMPFGDGVEFLSELRSRPATRSLPVVVVSAKADKARQVMNGSAVGVADWLMKPIDQPSLVQSLRRAVERRTELPRVLHVEDDADLSNVIATALHGKVELISVQTLRAAERELKRRRFDLLVLDPAMPDGNGLDLLERLPELGEPGIPVVILSASETSREVQGRVAATLVKSRLSEARIVETILSLVQRPSHR